MNRLPATLLMSFVVLASATAQDVAPRPRVLVSSAGLDVAYEYVDDKGLAEVVEKVSAHGGGSLTFPPGIYRFDQGIRLHGIRNVHFVGTPGTVFQFRPLTEFGAIRTTEPTPLADLKLVVDRPDLLAVGGRYQLLRPDLKGIRMMEFYLDSIEGKIVKAIEPTNMNGTTVPAGSWIIPYINFFMGWNCGEMSFTGITFDGNFDLANRKLGGKPYVGHTTHGGLLFSNGYLASGGALASRPATRNVRVSGCRFTNFLGRGATFYNVQGVTLRDCTFEDIGAEAIEIDHLSSHAVIGGCSILNAKIGMRLNDCTDTTVTGCIIENASVGIHLTEVLKGDTTNRRMTMTGNVITGGLTGMIFDGNVAETVAVGNTITGCSRYGIDMNGKLNVVVGNVISGCGAGGVKLVGQGSIIENNLILPPANAPAGWKGIEK